MPLAAGHLQLRRVALLIESSRAYARELVRGVAVYQRENQHWSISYTPRGLDDPPPDWLRDWEGDGILARINDRRMADAVARKGVPVIDLRRKLRDLPFPSLGPDDDAVALLAFEHLAERGFRHFGFAGLARGEHLAMDARADCFVRLASSSGLPCEVFHFARRRPGSQPIQIRQITRWLKALPKPLAVMACNDDSGLFVLQACRQAGILVPDEVAVIGVGNDDCLCDLALPSLSSVDLDPQRIGYEAARALDALMASRGLKCLHWTMPPRGVVARASTDVLATADQRLIQAVRFIREQACGPLRTSDVLRAVHMSRAALEPRFKATLGRTIHQEIQRVRLLRVQELLLGSNAPLKQIAMQAGFHSPEYMMRVFHRFTGQTPGEYRKAAGRTARRPNRQFPADKQAPPATPGNVRRDMPGA